MKDGSSILPASTMELDQWEKQILLKGLDALLMHYGEHPSAMHTPEQVQALRDKIAADAKVDW